MGVLHRYRQDERGQIIVLAAVMIPVFLLLTALVVDVGNWYVHKRQLQNRADAAALAAGVQYSSSWPACITDSTQEAAIRDAARQYSGDPAATDPVNTEIADPSKFDVMINSTSYTAGTDDSDGGGPCFDHPANTQPEGESNITPSGGYWTDVKVKERDLRSLFGKIGLDLLQNGARARVEIKEAASGDQFIPIAVPEQTIVKAQVRFVNECDGSQIGNAVVLKPLKTGYQTQGGMQLWGPDPLGNQASVDPGQVALTTPGDSAVPIPGKSTPACNSGNTLDYVPIGVEVRVAGRKDIDLDPPTPQRCTALQSMTSADCFRRISEIRVFRNEGGLFGDRPQIRDVTFSPSGSSPCLLDPYYTRLALGATNCTFDASVFMDWGSRPLPPDGKFEATIQVGSGTPRNLAGSPPQGPWTAAGIPISSLGPLNVQVNWKYTLTNGDWAPGSLTGCTAKKPCVKSGSTVVHRVNLADDPSGSTDPPSGPVAAVKLTTGPTVTSPEMHSAWTGTTISPYVTIGLKTAYRPGDFAVLRQRAGQKNFSVICDPYWGQPSSQDTSAAFYFGCQPPYASNDTTTPSFWWSASTGCPDWSTWFSFSGTPPNVDYPQAPWRCLHLQPGGKGQTIGDGIALRTKNCQTPDVADAPGPGVKGDCKASKYTCNYGVNYNGGTNFPGLDDPRVVRLFVVPYGAYKGVANGNVADIPVLQLAAFYITAWKYNGRGDPCTKAGDGAISPGLYGNDNAKIGDDELGGYFIKLVDSSGPVDPKKNCNPTDVTICRPALTR